MLKVLLRLVQANVQTLLFDFPLPRPVLLPHWRPLRCQEHRGAVSRKKKNRKGGKAAASSGPRASPGQILSIHSPGHLRGLGQAHSAAVCGAVSRTTRTCKFGSCSVHLTRGCQPYGQPGGGQPAASGCKTCPDCRDGPEPIRVRLRIHDVVCSLPFLCPP